MMLDDTLNDLWLFFCKPAPPQTSYPNLPSTLQGIFYFFLNASPSSFNKASPQEQKSKSCMQNLLSLIGEVLYREFYYIL